MIKEKENNEPDINPLTNNLDQLPDHKLEKKISDGMSKLRIVPPAYQRQLISMIAMWRDELVRREQVKFFKQQQQNSDDEFDGLIRVD